MFTWPTTASKSPQLSDMGSALLYYLVIKPISLLPYPLLYLVSDLTRLIVYRVVGYRRKVVASNIAGAFPDLSPRERVAIERKFYKHFCDLIVESLKNFSITEKQARKRMVERNPEVINRYASQGISTVMCGGHFNNWELWAVEAGLSLDPLVVGIYKRLSNPFFDKKMKDSRSKFGLMMIPTKEVGKGTGLGLSIVKGILDDHRADVAVESTLGEGTSFSLTFPLDHRPEPESP